MRVLVTGGAGFVGSSVAVALARVPSFEIIAVDNLRRPGAYLNVQRLNAARVTFCHGDVRNYSDLEPLGDVDLILECSAEASVHAGYGESPAYLVETNLVGTTNCLELARRADASFVFMSTSRVYPIEGLRNLPLVVKGARFELPPDASGEGWSTSGISASFPLGGGRSLYGATKLASELLVLEYASVYGMPAVVNRCGVIAGPWQMGSAAQGFTAHWVAAYVFEKSLRYLGYGGHGHQVRDVLHIEDLVGLIKRQIDALPQLSGWTFNIGGGPANSISVAELTAVCNSAAAGRSIEHIPRIETTAETRDADIPYYVTDIREVGDVLDWRPEHSVEDVVDDLFDWMIANRVALQGILA